MEDFKRSMKQLGKSIEKAAREAEKHGTTERTVTRGASRNVATAVNVGRKGAVTGVSVRQRTRTLKDGSQETETVRTTWG